MNIDLERSRRIAQILVRPDPEKDGRAVELRDKGVNDWHPVAPRFGILKDHPEALREITEGLTSIVYFPVVKARKPIIVTTRPFGEKFAFGVASMLNTPLTSYDTTTREFPNPEELTYYEHDAAILIDDYLTGGGSPATIIERLKEEFGIPTSLFVCVLASAGSEGIAKIENLEVPVSALTTDEEIMKNPDFLNTRNYRIRVEKINRYRASHRITT